MATKILFFFWCIFAAAILVQGQPGFITIDCGLDANTSYKDNLTGIEYVSDAAYIDTGENHNISSDYLPNADAVQNTNLRSFSDNTRNCYTLKPVLQGNKYMIRAAFMYGNYDGKNRIPRFNIYIGANLWDTFKFMGQRL